MSRKPRREADAEAARRASAAAKAAAAAQAAADALEAKQDEETAEAVVAAVAASQRRGRWFSVPQENVIAACALMLSLIIATINVYFALRGPQVVVRPPDQVLLYNDNGVLSVAVPVLMINVAGTEHGDVLLEADLAVGPRRTPFPGYQTVIQPVYREDAAEAAGRCDVTMRCTALKDMLFIERIDEVVDIPGGAAKSRYLTFSLQSFYCKGGKAAGCDRFDDFDHALAELGPRPHLEMRIQLHSDGARTLVCDAGPLHRPTLSEYQWIGLKCETAEVRGNPVL